MKSRKEGSVHILLIERGERIIESLTAYCKKHSIYCGSLTGIGAVDEAEIAHYIVDNKKYSSKVFKEPMEITNMSGNIAIMDGEPYLHCHISLGLEDFSLVGGHLKEARVHAVCEIYLDAIEGKKIERVKDDSLGLNVCKFK